MLAKVLFRQNMTEVVGARETNLASRDLTRPIPKNRMVEAIRRHPSSRETVPTAFVSPQTVRVGVQPGYGKGGVVPPTSAVEAADSAFFVHSSPPSTISTADSPSTSGIASFYSSSKLTSNDSLLDDRSRWSASNLSIVSEVWTNAADSDDRLERLERRMRLLESQLGGGPQLRPSFESNPGPGDPARRELSCSCSSLVQFRARGPHSPFHPVHSISAAGPSPCGCFGGPVAYKDNDRITVLSEKVKQLQAQLDGERRIRTNLVKQNSKELVWKVDENETLKSRVKELEAENQMWKERAGLGGSFFGMADDSAREIKRLRETVDVLESRLARSRRSPARQEHSRAPEPAPDQYVPIHKYRLLKAKSKKLLSDKCEALRAESLAKESLRVQLMLQNKELSELRKLVYESKFSDCECCKNLNDSRAELLRLIDSCAFVASCLLGVCCDVAAKKCPDYDQILGLKSFEGCRSPSTEQPESSPPDSRVFYGRMLTSARSLRDRLSRMQRIMIDYYTEELVDSIDCRLQ